MPREVMIGRDGNKYYLTEMDYRPTEAEIYADGWKPPVHVSNIYEEYVGAPRAPSTTPASADDLEVLRFFEMVDEQGRPTEKGLKYGVTQAYLDGTETEEDIYKQEAVQAERFRIAYGHYYLDNRRARIILNRE